MKTCSLCRNPKPFDEFYISRATRDGRQPRCKPCDNGHRSGRTVRPDGDTRAVREGLTLAEIADRLGISRARVMQIESRALVKLRKEMKRSGMFKEERRR